MIFVPSLLACDGTPAVNEPAQCDVLTTYAGDVLIEGEDADAQAAGFCADFNAVEGSFQVQGASWNDLTPISCLCSVSEDFVLSSMGELSDLSGLNLQYVGRAVNLLNVDRIVDLAGLPSDLEAGGLEILGNDALVTTDPFRLPYWADHAVEVSQNPALTDLLAWSDVERVGRIYLDSPLVETLAGLNSLREIGGSAYFTDCGLRSLEGFDSLESGYISLVGCPDLTSLSGLRQPAVLKGLVVGDAPKFRTPGELPDGISIGTLALHDAALISLAGLERATITSQLQIGDCDLLTSLDGFPSQAGTLDDVYLYDLPALASIEALSGVEVVANEIKLRDLSSLDSLEGLHNVGSAGEVWLSDLNSLRDVDGLRGLRVVESGDGTGSGSFYLYSSDELVDLGGLHGIERVEGGMDALGGNIPQSECDALLEAIGEENIGGLFRCS